jgi:hypothetical protein
MTRSIRAVGRAAVVMAVVAAAVVGAAGFGARSADAQAALVANPGGPYSGQAGQPITFNAGASVGATSYTWNFGDGTQATGMVATKSYASNGVFTVTLTVANAFGQIQTATTTATIGVVTTVPQTNVVSVYNPYYPYYPYNNYWNGCRTVVVQTIYGPQYRCDGYWDTWYSRPIAVTPGTPTFPVTQPISNPGVTGVKPGFLGLPGGLGR